MNGFAVVDASLAAKWLLYEDNSDRARALSRRWTDDGTLPVAPYLLPVEVANVLHRRVVRGELNLGMAVRLVETLLASGVELRETPQIHVRTLELADELGQGAVYDSHYLALTESLGCDLWTADERFYRAATRESFAVNWIGTFEPG